MNFDADLEKISDDNGVHRFECVFYFLLIYPVDTPLMKQF